MNALQLRNLKTYELARDAAMVAEIRAELYGDEYAVVYVPYGFVVIRVGDLALYGVKPGDVLTSRCTDLEPEARRKRLSEMLVAATTHERVA
jgi:hypothetical protein